MTPVDLGALVIIAGRVLGQDVPAVLDLLDVAAAEAALAEAALTGAARTEAAHAEAAHAEDGSSAAPADPAERAAALLSALIRHRPLARGNDQAAVLAAVTFLAMNGWQVDLEPAEATAAVVADLAAGRWSAADLTAWLSPRISGYREPAAPRSPAKEAPMHGWLPNLRRTARSKGDSMFRRFSPQAREVIISAQQEARALHHNFIGTEHLLLGLLRDRDGAAGRALHALGVSPEAARQQVLDIIGEGKQEPTGHIPFTPRSKRALELAVREAVRLGHLHVGTEHILLGLVSEGDGVAWHVLDRLGATMPRVRNQVLELVQPGPAGAEPGHHAARHPGLRHPDRADPAGQGRGRGREGLRAGRDRARDREGVAGRAGPSDRAVVGRGGPAPRWAANSTGCVTR